MRSDLAHISRRRGGMRPLRGRPRPGPLSAERTVLGEQEDQERNDETVGDARRRQRTGAHRAERAGNVKGR
jgi:hypothetical protein